MKILLASLMCLVLGASECFALKGGPVYPRTVNVVGTYTGLFIPKEAGSMNLGLFSISIPQQGIASGGTLVIFTGARTFTGDIQGLGDSRTGSFRGIIEAIPYISTGSGSVTTLNVHADGTLNAQVKTFTVRGFTSISTTHLIGDAHIVTNGLAAEPLETDYIVDGIKE